MDDLSSFVEGLVNQLGRAFLLAGLLPALVFVAVNQYLIFGPAYAGVETVWNFFPDVSSPWLGLFSGEMLTAITLALGLGLLLVVLNGLITRLFEGLLPGTKAALFPLTLRNLRRYKTIYAPIAAKHAERRAALARRDESGEYTDSDEQSDLALFEELHQLHTEKEKSDAAQALPYNRQRVSPTAFGNAWAVMEEYPYTRYGMDGMLFWPYVRDVIGQQNPRLLDDIDNHKLIIDIVMNLALTMALLVVEGLVFTLLRGQWQMLVLALIALGLFLAFYRAGVGYAWAMGGLVGKGFDLYRLPVLDAFGIKRPEDLDEEYWTWTRLAAFIRRGEPFYFEMLDRAEGDTN